MYNKDGFEVKQHVVVGGIDWTIIETKVESVLCISTDSIGTGTYGNTNNFKNSGICPVVIDKVLDKFAKDKYLDGMDVSSFFRIFTIDLTDDNGKKNYGIAEVVVGLITCDQYRQWRDNIPPIDKCWWTATPYNSDSDPNFVKIVDETGNLTECLSYLICSVEVRPVVMFDSLVLREYLKKKEEQEKEEVSKDTTPEPMDIIEKLKIAEQYIKDAQEAFTERNK